MRPSILKQVKQMVSFMAKSATINLISALSPHDRITLEIARMATMWNKPRASSHLGHYLSGQGTDVCVETSDLFRDDVGVRCVFYKDVSTQLRRGLTQGNATVPQWAYTNEDWLYALGGIEINWFTKGDSVTAWFVNWYCWHPNEQRLTQRLHQAAENLKTHGAKEFFILGSRVKSRLKDIEINTVRPRKKPTDFYLL